MGCSNGSCAINAPNFLPSQSVQKFDASGSICGGTSSFVPGGGGCGHCSACRAEQAKQATTVPSGNICGGTSSFTPAGDGCGCSSCSTKRMRRGAGNKFPGVRRVGTDFEDPRGKMFIPNPPVSDKRRQMLPNGGGVAQIIPTRTAEPVKAQGAATPAFIPAEKTKPTDLGGGPATNPVMEGKKQDLGGGPADKVAMNLAGEDVNLIAGPAVKVALNLAGQDLVRWTAPDYCSDDRLAATELCRQGGDQQLSEGCRRELRAFIASGDKTPLAQWVNTRELCSGELQRLLGLVEKVKTSAGLWPVYQSSGAAQYGWPVYQSSGAPMSAPLASMSTPLANMNLDELPFGASVFVDGMRVNLYFPRHYPQGEANARVPEGVHTIMVVDQKGNIRSVKALITRQNPNMVISYSSMASGQKFGSSGAPMAVIQPMRFANPSKPSFLPAMSVLRPSSGMYRPSGVDMSATEEEAAGDDWNQQLLRDTSSTASGGKGGKGGSDDDNDDKDDNDDDRDRGPSTTDYITSIGNVAVGALGAVSRTITQQADLRLRQLMESNRDTANARMEANRTLQIELDGSIRRAQLAATAAAGTAGGGAQVAQLQAEIRGMQQAQTRSNQLALENAPPAQPLAPPLAPPPQERTPVVREEPKGLSTPAMVGIGVGAVAVLGLGAYLVMRKR